MKSFRRWHVGHLVGSWAAYWGALVAVTLGPAFGAGWRASRPDAQGSISAGMTDGIANITVTQGGATTWTGSASLLTITLLVAVPPLLLWVAWLITGSRARAAAATATEALPGAPVPGMQQRTRDGVHHDR